MPDASEPYQGAHPAIAKRGRLELAFSASPGGRTYIGEQFSSYPFHVCRPFYLDVGPCAGMATVYTQSCSGGLYGMDRLIAEMTVDEGAQAHLTTQASTIVHRARDGMTEQVCSITANAGAFMEYLPDATILFPGAHLKSSVRLALDESASAIVFDSFLPHALEDASDTFEMFDNTVAIHALDGTPLAIERFRVSGEEFVKGRLGVTGGYPCHGSVIAVAPDLDVEELIAKLRHRSSGVERSAIGFSRLPNVNGLSMRILSADAVPVRNAMLDVWREFRAEVTGAAPKPRRK